MIALTIEVKSAQKQNIDVSIENKMAQNVGLEQKQNSEIFLKNTPVQNVGVEQDVILVPVYKDAIPYEGDYEVTPKVDAQTMPTKGKLMEEDVTIKSIPFFDVSNTSGGSTVYIGNEV